MVGFYEGAVVVHKVERRGVLICVKTSLIEQKISNKCFFIL